MVSTVRGRRLPDRTMVTGHRRPWMSSNLTGGLLRLSGACRAMCWPCPHPSLYRAPDGLAESECSHGLARAEGLSNNNFRQTADTVQSPRGVITARSEVEGHHLTPIGRL